MCRGRQTCRFSNGHDVDRVAIPDQVEQPRFVELLGGPLVEALQPRRDHRVVEQPAETLLVGDIPPDVARSG